jgi:hypothetical protein
MRGLVSFYYDSRRKCVVARKWPRKRATATPAEIANREAFALIAHQVVTEPAEITDFAKQLSKGTDFLWRDLLMAAAYGNLLVTQNNDGTSYVGGKQTMATIQQLLDSISATVGGMLVRTSAGWASLTGGTPGQLLTIGISSLPEWDDPASPTLDEISAALDLITNTHGAVLFRGATEWTALEPATAGYVLSTNGADEDPSWVPQSGGGGGTSNNWGEALVVSDSAGHDIPSAGVVLLCNGAGGQTLSMPTAPNDGDVCRVLAMNLGNINGMYLQMQAGQTCKGYVTAASGGISGGQSLEGYDIVTFYWNAATSTWWSSHYGY